MLSALRYRSSAAGEFPWRCSSWPLCRFSSAANQRSPVLSTICNPSSNDRIASPTYCAVSMMEQSRAASLICLPVRGPAGRSELAGLSTRRWVRRTVQAPAQGSCRAAGCAALRSPGEVEAAQRSPQLACRGRGTGPLPCRSPNEVEARVRSPAGRCRGVAARAAARLVRQSLAASRRAQPRGDGFPIWGGHLSPGLARVACMFSVRRLGDRCGGDRDGPTIGPPSDRSPSSPTCPSPSR
jgi:hypothetical protein